MRSELVAAAGTALLLTAAGCDGGPPPGPVVAEAPAWTPERAQAAQELAARLVAREPAVPDGLRVELAFGAAVDLDLYVTDPLEETVYYANSPSRSGGTLVQDQRCAHPAPRVETIRFPAPLAPGRYRIGVDYPRACGAVREPAPFAVAVDGPGGRTAHQGLARHQVFEPIVLEFEIAAGGEGER
ncbi:MAG: hypothetical protein OZ948_06540 [Deltaproteobacteria bacterium]|nr:hypothetical protein [Deltaproteobacteria bacterium]